MRTVLAAAAAGALIMGSAAGAMAAPKEKAAPTPYMQVRMVNVHNGYVNIHPDAKHRVIKAKANVWDSAKKVAPTSLTFTLAQYSKKGDGNIVAPPVLGPLSIVLSSKASVDKKSKNYNGMLDVYKVIEEMTDAGKKQAIKDSIAVSPVLLCLDGVDLAEPTDDPNTLEVNEAVMEKAFKKQVDKKIGTDCVRVVNIDPKLTEGTFDDK